MLSAPTEQQVRSVLEESNDLHFIFERDGAVTGVVLCRIHDGWLGEISRPCRAAVWEGSR